MSSIDYMRVIDIISKTFNAHKEVDLKATHDRHDKIDKFDIVMTTIDGVDIAYRILLHRHELDILFKKTIFENKKFKKWLSVFEYELEQKLITNIKISVIEETVEYLVKVGF